MSRKESNIKFVGLHAHSVAGSLFDAIGYPQEHMNFAYENGSDALALTDHGNMNGLAYQVLHAKKMKEEGKDFKPIFGCEAYFTPSIAEWREAYDKAMEDKKKARSIKKDTASGATVEDEGDSKKIAVNFEAPAPPSALGSEPNRAQQSLQIGVRELQGRKFLPLPSRRLRIAEKAR